MLKVHAVIKKYKLSKYFEAFTGIIALTVINLIFFRSDPGFVNVSPHPYWIIVLLTASRYGFSGGAFAGSIAAIAYLGFTLLSVPDLALVNFKSLSMWGKPALFFIVGVVIGEMRELNIKEYNLLSEERDAYKEAFGKIKTKFDVLSEAKQEIDTRIISQENTLGTLYEAAQGLRSLNEESIFPAVLEILRDFMSVEDCSIYTLEGDEFKLNTAMRHGKSPLPDTIPYYEGLMGLAAEDKKTVSIKDVANPESMPLGIIISAPILADNQKHVIGVLNVEKMPFMKFNSDSVRIAGLVADWCGSSIENATIFQETKDKLIADEMIDAYTYDYFKRRLREEFVRSRRYELDLSLILLEFPSLENASDEGREDVLMAFSMILKNQIREIDILFLNDKPGSFFLILPTTPPAGARVVVKNILNAFKALSMMAFESDASLVEIRAGVSGYSMDMEEPMDMVKAVEEDVVSVLFAE
ncbi:sensor domain-containing diguanylate cyclase [Desulfovibrio gilichinskyi]|uniref:GAF domain-containing protein n=1 Tax=Desulfovibrio gilichinskyi TaxID=1519643 RepID=A0A1X7D5I8_9BACT|nr:GAF domain-containing protein [Desulfovibrio gilichinskyi]SMF09190.1 GAF domain-containing protein [Desulfovibrio gilichinskyi]